MRVTKTILSVAILAAMTAVPHFATADVVTGFTTTEGVSEGDTNITGAANLTEFSTAGFSYTSLTGVGIVGANSAESLHANTLTAPASSSAAVSDLNLAIGTLNVNAAYDISSATASDSIFVFGNGNGGVADPIGGSGGTTPPGATINFFAADGTTLVGTISNSVFFQTNGDRAPNLASFDFTRGNGNALNNRTISGFVFDVGEIALEAGATVADLAHINLQSGSMDIQDVGIATTKIAIPEPSSAMLLIGGLGAILARRRK